MSGKKVCKICEVEKDRNKDFYKSSQKSKRSGGNRVTVWDSYCKPCRSDFSYERRRKIKRQAVEYLGGKCFDCGRSNDEYPDIFDFHHREPSKKDFQIGKVNKSFEDMKSELDKCDLLCAVCHRIVHARKIGIFNE